jgi:type II secretory pathway component PulF
MAWGDSQLELPMSTDDFVALNEEIAGMARAGFPLDQGLSELAKDMSRGRLKRITTEIADELKKGRTLPEALQSQRGRIPPFYASLVNAGIRSGRLNEVLATMTVYARSLADLRATMVGALFYPAVVLAFAIALFVGCVYFILPQFVQIFNNFQMTLPALTQAVIWVAGHALFFVLPILVIGGGLLFYWFGSRFSVRGRLVWARFVYMIPIVGTMVRATRLASFTELLGIMVDRSVPLPEAFSLAGRASSDPIMAIAAGQVEEDLQSGISLSMALRNRHLVPELVAWMMGSGEQRGRLGESLHQLSNLYRQQAEMRVAFLRYVFPPFMIIMTAGIFVGIFVMAMMLPMLKLLENLSK